MYESDSTDVCAHCTLRYLQMLVKLQSCDMTY